MGIPVARRAIKHFLDSDKLVLWVRYQLFMDLEGITVERWRRYGNDRLYVTGSDAAKVGWIDMVARVVHPESASETDLLEGVLEDWDGRVVEVATPSTQPATPAESWTDLALTGAGDAAREQAVAAREAAPARTLLARVLRVHTDERAWRLGADGEESVARGLAKLQKKDPRWHVLHAIRVGARGADIDHLVIGPGGVFSINAKNHPRKKVWVGGDTLMVNGARQPYVRNSRHEAARASRMLTSACGFDVKVSGVIALVNVDDVTIKKAPEDVAICTRMQLKRWLLRRPETLRIEQIEAIFEAARRSTTWQ
jgi:hypothetical protein